MEVIVNVTFKVLIKPGQMRSQSRSLEVTIKAKSTVMVSLQSGRSLQTYCFHYII